MCGPSYLHSQNTETRDGFRAPLISLVTTKPVAKNTSGIATLNLLFWLDKKLSTQGRSDLVGVMGNLDTFPLDDVHPTTSSL